jgi:hypothetical protein
LYDPGTNTFEVMDHLDYGLEEPKLAFQGDGNLFISGIVQSPTLALAARTVQGGFGQSFSQSLSTSAPASGTVLNGNIKVQKIGLIAMNAGGSVTSWESFKYGVDFLVPYADHPIVSDLWMDASHFALINKSTAFTQAMITHGFTIPSYTYYVPAKNPDGSIQTLPDGTVIRVPRVAQLGSNAPTGIHSRPANGDDPGDLRSIQIEFDDPEYGHQVATKMVPLLPLPGAKSGIAPNPITADLLVLGFCWSTQAYQYWLPSVKPKNASRKTSVVLTFNREINIDFLARALADMLYENGEISADAFATVFGKYAKKYTLSSDSYNIFYQ